MIKVRCIPRIHGGTVKRFYKWKYNVWKTLAINRAEPHYFRLSH